MQRFFSSLSRSIDCRVRSIHSSFSSQKKMGMHGLFVFFLFYYLWNQNAFLCPFSSFVSYLPTHSKGGGAPRLIRFNVVYKVLLPYQYVSRGE